MVQGFHNLVRLMALVKLDMVQGFHTLVLLDMGFTPWCSWTWDRGSTPW